MTDLAKLGAGWSRLKQGTLWHATGKCKGYADANPGEAATLDAYVLAVVAGKTPPTPTLATATGQGLAQIVAAAVAPAPAPTPTPTPTPPPAGSNPVPPPASGCYFGAYIEGKQTYAHYYPGERAWDNPPWDLATWDRFEQNAGKKISMLMTGAGYVWEGSFGDLDFILSSNAQRGTIPVIDLATDGLGTLADFAVGKYDAQIDALAAHFKTFGKPCVLRIDAEMNGHWYKFGAEIGASAAGPANFVATWKRIVDRFRAAGATNVAYHWCPNVDVEATWDGTKWVEPKNADGTNHVNPIENLYPGDDFVDWTGLTGYNHGTAAGGGSASESVDFVFDKTYQRVLAIASKPMMIGEVGCADQTVPTANPAKAAWIADLFAKLPVKYPQVRAFCWFNWFIFENNAYFDWPIESSPAALAAFKAAIASPYYV